MTQVESYDPAARAVRSARDVLGCLLEQPRLWPDAAELRLEYFVLNDHRKIFKAIADLNDHNCVADITSVYDALGENFPAGALAALVDGALPENFKSYVHRLRQATRDRQFHELHRQLGETKTAEDRVPLLDLMQRVTAGEGDAQNWRSIFHTIEECENAPPLRFAIGGFLQEAGVTLIGGLAGHGKTIVMLAMAKALLEERPLFEYAPFSVSRSAARVCYLIPESSIGPFWSRIKLFRLEEFVKQDRLLIRTLSCPEQIELTDPRVLKAVEGADVFLDSVIRFTIGSENDAENIRQFSDVLFRLLRSGARTITGCHHSPKSFETAQAMSLENVLRGSGDLGAMISTCWGIRQIDAARNKIYVENVKPRDFQPCAPFILEGRPHLDVAGQFKMHAKPGEAEELRSYLQQKGGRPLAPNRAEQIAMAASLRAKGESLREIAAKLKVSKDTVTRMLDDYDLADRDPEEEGRKLQ